METKVIIFFYPGMDHVISAKFEFCRKTNTTNRNYIRALQLVHVFHDRDVPNARVDGRTGIDREFSGPIVLVLPLEILRPTTGRRYK